MISPLTVITRGRKKGQRYSELEPRYKQWITARCQGDQTRIRDANISIKGKPLSEYSSDELDLLTLDVDRITTWELDLIRSYTERRPATI
jgi:hypothetical protein